MATSSLTECYSLLIKIEKKIALNVGRLGNFSFPKGYYVYTGRRRGGVTARIQRHMRREKHLRWHIDYLTSTAEAKIIKVIVYDSKAEEECKINKVISKMPKAEIPIPGFGNSDCRSGCRSHLVYFRELPDLKSIEFAKKEVD